MPNFNNDPIVSVATNANQIAIQGESSENEGIRGVSHNAHGAVVGINDFAPAGPPGAGGNGGWFESAQGEGVRGVSHNSNHGGVVGVADKPGGTGVFGTCDEGTGVIGESKTWIGVFGESQDYEGVQGVSHNADHAAVVGLCDKAGGTGVYGKCAEGTGVMATSTSGNALYAKSDQREAIHGETQSMQTAAIAAYQLNPASETAAFYAKHMGNRTAGVFEGDVRATGTVHCHDMVPAGADCAEEFDVADFQQSEPGTVMVIGDEGSLHPCVQAYDRRVGGVISGAGSYATAITLDKTARADRKAIALVGKVFCKADAAYGPIRIGDLLTTSSTHGHAMKATEPLKAFGAVLGKALASLESGRGLIPILVALQ